MGVYYAVVWLVLLSLLAPEADISLARRLKHLYTSPAIPAHRWSTEAGLEDKAECHICTDLAEIFKLKQFYFNS